MGSFKFEETLLKWKASWDIHGYSEISWKVVKAITKPMACELGLRRCWDFIFQRIRSKTSARNRLRKSRCPQCPQTLPATRYIRYIFITFFSFCSRVTAHSADTAAVCLGCGSKSDAQMSKPKVNTMEQDVEWRWNWAWFMRKQAF